MIKPWIFEFFAPWHGPTPSAFDAERCSREYAWYLDLWTNAEALGFEGIFFSEHHFFPGRYSPSPNLLIAATAARTRTLRLGVMGQVLPLYEPWRVAEECAMLDQLSGGRLEMGFSSGVGPREYKMVGIAAEEVKPRFAEAMQIIGLALSQERFSHHGRFWHLTDLSISPRALQQPLPPRWITGLSMETAAQAATGGFKFCTGFMDTAQAVPIFAHYREVARAAGQPATSEQLGLRRQVIIADDDAEARAIGDEAMARMRKMMGGGPPSAPPAAGAAPAVAPAAPAKIGSIAPDAPSAPHRGPFIGDDETIAGSPATVAEQLIAQCQAMGAGHLLAYAPGTISAGQMLRSQQLWRDVIPKLRAAKVS